MAFVKENSYTVRNTPSHPYNPNNHIEIGVRPNDAFHCSNLRVTDDVLSRFWDINSKTCGMTTDHNVQQAKIPHCYIGNAIQKRKTTGQITKMRTRIGYQPAQLQALEKEFASNRYIDRLRNFQLAEQLKLSTTHIRRWFQNRRTKAKKEAVDEVENTQLDINDGEVRMTGRSVKATIRKTTPLLLIRNSDHYDAKLIQQFRPTGSQQIRQKEFQNQRNFQHSQNSVNPNFFSMGYPPFYRNAVDFKGEMTQRKLYPIIIQQPYYIPNIAPQRNMHQEQTTIMQSPNMHHQRSTEEIPGSPGMHQQFQNNRNFLSHQLVQKDLMCNTQLMSNRTSPYFHPTTVLTSECNKIEAERQEDKCNKDNVINIKDVTTVKKETTDKNVHDSDDSDCDTLILMPEVQQIKNEHQSTDEYESDVETEVKTNINLDDLVVMNESRKKNSILSRLVFEDDDECLY